MKVFCNTVNFTLLFEVLVLYDQAKCLLNSLNLAKLNAWILFLLGETPMA